MQVGRLEKVWERIRLEHMLKCCLQYAGCTRSNAAGALAHIIWLPELPGLSQTHVGTDCGLAAGVQYLLRALE
jgi:hypothetical protein